jgi:Tol biopolymer transport system component
MRLSALILCVIVSIAVASSSLSLQLENQLALMDLAGTRTPVGQVPGRTFAPRISPDGSEVVFDTQDDGALWIATLSNVAARRKLSTGGSNRGPIWSADGKRILYITDYQNEEALYWRAADGTGTPEQLARPVRAPESLSPMGKELSFITLMPGGDYDVFTYAFATKQKTPFIVVAGSPQHSSHFSPDGKWIAYVSAESGQLEVYVRPFPAGTPAVQVSTSGGEHPQWSPDQKELFFDSSNRMYAVAISIGRAFTGATPVALPITGFIQGPLRRQYDLMPDGKHFLMMFPPAR